MHSPQLAQFAHFLIVVTCRNPWRCANGVFKVWQSHEPGNTKTCRRFSATWLRKGKAERSTKLLCSFIKKLSLYGSFLLPYCSEHSPAKPQFCFWVGEHYGGLNSRTWPSSLWAISQSLGYRRKPRANTRLRGSLSLTLMKYSLLASQRPSQFSSKQPRSLSGVII